MSPTGNTLPGAGFNLAATLDSGQVFHWESSPDSKIYAGLIGNHPTILHQEATGSPVTILEGDPEATTSYLGLDHDLTAILSTFPRADPHLERALDYCPGLRILRQPRWECLASFITSPQKNISAIRKISLTLRRRFGTRVEAGGHHFHTYPEPAVLAEASETTLRTCSLGYRARSLHRAASRIASGEIDLKTIAALPDNTAREALCNLYGVGEKIADCVLLFAYGRLGAFPVDVWIERVLRELYFKDKNNVTPQHIRAFARDHFGENRGYAQQFLFHYARQNYTGKGGFKTPS